MLLSPRHMGCFTHELQQPSTLFHIRCDPFVPSRLHCAWGFVGFLGAGLAAVGSFCAGFVAVLLPVLLLVCFGCRLGVLLLGILLLFVSFLELLLMLCCFCSWCSSAAAGVMFCLCLWMLCLLLLLHRSLLCCCFALLCCFIHSVSSWVCETAIHQLEREC